MKGNPVRVLRQSNKKSGYAPKEGIRYDGLYQITARECLKVETAFYRFTLQRLPGQDPIRYHGVEARPTYEELAELSKMKELLA